MNNAQQQWKLLSERLGVKPKKLALLLGALAITVCGLGMKYSSRAANTISEPVITSQTTPTATAENQIQTNEARVNTVSFTGTDSEPSPQLIEMTFDHTPSRNPFKAVGAPEAEPTKAAYAPVVAQTKTPGLLPGMMLKAVIRGELAVFGDQTVRVGDAVALPDGTFASVRAIADRSVTVDYDNRVIEVCFGAASQSKTIIVGSK